MSLMFDFHILKISDKHILSSGTLIYFENVDGFRKWQKQAINLLPDPDTPYLYVHICRSDNKVVLKHFSCWNKNALIVLFALL